MNIYQLIENNIRVEVIEASSPADAIRKLAAQHGLTTFPAGAVEELVEAVTNWRATAHHNFDFYETRLSQALDRITTPPAEAKPAPVVCEHDLIPRADLPPGYSQCGKCGWVQTPNNKRPAPQMGEVGKTTEIRNALGTFHQLRYTGPMCGENCEQAFSDFGKVMSSHGVNYNSTKSTIAAFLRSWADSIEADK